ncbi:uncharacterized protein LOC141601215 [Silene latifolia]|uniref:uncharacterized protein LOC141601215 n=1 Tax=Silene latifolia TaxID=37657 RepID=UPI003D7847E6
MGVDRKNYVMSAEIAMAREMAFKNKLQKLSMESSCSSTDPFHSQVPAQISSQRSGMPQGSVPPPFPRPHTGLTRTWTPILSTSQTSMSTPIWRPINPTDQKRKAPINPDHLAHLGTFYCLVCKIDCTTSYNLMMHYQGQRHMAKLLGQPMGKKIPSGSGSGSALSTAKDRLYCKFCGIWCKDEFVFRLHLQCKNHLLTLQEHEKNKKPRI